MTQVVPFPDEPIEAALKRFSKKVNNSGILQEVRSRQAYVKPSDAARKEKAAAKARIAKLKRKMDRFIAHQNEFKSRPKQKLRPNNNRPSQSSTKQTPIASTNQTKT